MENIMEQIKEYLPFLIPLVIVQFALLIYVIRHILTHDTYKRGNRMLWLVISIVLMNFVGPILYLVFGKEDA
ncbi:MAG: PLD nuclease N-terminal domain-containing protein [Clostridium sp.]|nr:PLD nuclease N-terminal domain-containing protein [Clostridium sp.]